MIIQKIAKFEKHDENSYSVWYENIGTQRAILTKAQFDLAQCIDEFLRRAIDPKDIRRILDLSSNVVVEETLDDMGGYPVNNS